MLMLRKSFSYFYNFDGSQTDSSVLYRKKLASDTSETTRDSFSEWLDTSIKCKVKYKFMSEEPLLCSQNGQ